ncbi:MAG TPA: hypothetical protein VF556_14365 [Pyrinomonadaceae bacterium]|jgi:hypothetical protein
MNKNTEKETAINVEAVSQLAIKKGYSLLSSEYNESSLMTAIANNNLTLYAPIMQKKIQEIREQKKLLDNEILRDKDIQKLLKRRDKELRKLNFSIFKIIIDPPKRPKDASLFKERILSVLSQSDTKETLSEKMKMSYEALSQAMYRNKLKMITLKNELKM